jgi:hypothetical protein
MNTLPILKIFTLASSQSHLEWESLLGDKYREAAKFQMIEVDAPQNADVIIWDGVLNPKSRELIESLKPFLDKGVPLVLTGERRAFIEESVVAETLVAPAWKTIILPPWGSLPESLLLSLAEFVRKDAHV